MAYNGFNKSMLTNLKHSLSKEILLTGHSGAYHCTTVAGCNTRKYHGLLVSPVDALGGERYVLLSGLDITLIEQGTEFKLGIHQYPSEHFYPNGHKYLYHFSDLPVKRCVYQLGDITLELETVFSQWQDQIIFKYTLKEAKWGVRMRFNPILAFRNIHELTHTNIYADTRSFNIDGGIKYRLYENFPFLHLQFSHPFQYTHIPQWYKDVEYSEEEKRGYHFREDLLCPGYFEVDLERGDTIYVSASTSEANSKELFNTFNKSYPTNNKSNTLAGHLKRASKQFIIQNSYGTEVIAGYPWFGPKGRETFISLAGLTLHGGEITTCENILDTMVNRIQEGLFPNYTSPSYCSYNSADAPLWFIRVLEQYSSNPRGDMGKTWRKYGSAIRSILNSFKQGTSYNIKMQSNGLIYGGEQGKALTWMDAVIDGHPVTPRMGYVVEVNALWYNAIEYCLELSRKNRDHSFTEEWESVAELISSSFRDIFWDDDKGYLADYVLPPFKDWAVRPNQIIAASLPYSPLTKDQKKAVVDLVEKELFTPKGLRTLSPKNESYKGEYSGNQAERDRSYHQGSVWPWLLEHFCRAYIDVYKKNALPLLDKVIENFEPEVKRHGMGTISELFDGDPPHRSRGALSYAPSVSALIEIIHMREKAKTQYSQHRKHHSKQ